MSAYKAIRLESLKRGETFEQKFTIRSGHTPEMFTGGVWCTLRTTVPDSSSASDDDCLAQVSDLDGGITWSSVGDPPIYTGKFTFAAQVTRSFPLENIYGEVRGIIGSGPGRVIPEVAIGGFIVPITGDLTRGA